VLVIFHAENGRFIEMFARGAEGGFDNIFIFLFKEFVMNYHGVNNNTVDADKADNPPELEVDIAAEDPHSGD
jgi:hypothetical protein